MLFLKCFQNDIFYNKFSDRNLYNIIIFNCYPTLFFLRKDIFNSKKMILTVNSYSIYIFFLLFVFYVYLFNLKHKDSINFLIFIFIFFYYLLFIRLYVN